MRAAPFLAFAVALAVACEPDGEPPPASEGEGEGEGESVEPGGTIVVDPVACDFGRVAIGAIAPCAITIENVGVRDLVVDGAAFLDVDGAADPAAPFLPLVNVGTIAPGEGVTVDLRFRPNEAGAIAGVLRILSNDVVTPALDVPLSGIGVAPPVCGMRVKSVNGIEVVDEPPTIEVLDQVVLSIDASSPTSTSSFVRSEWVLVSAPADAHAELTTNDLPDTGLVVDAPGDYEICAQVFDDLGTGSVNDCCITLHVVNGLTMRAQLTEDDGDSLALHVTKRAPDGAFCIEGGADLVSTDCANDRACDASACTPDWDGATATHAGPAFGIETIDGNALVDGDYLVSLRSIAPGTGTLRIYVYGQLGGELFITAGEPGSVQDIAIVRVAAFLACVEDLTDGVVDDDCP